MNQITSNMQKDELISIASMVCQNDGAPFIRLKWGGGGLTFKAAISMKIVHDIMA